MLNSRPLTFIYSEIRESSALSPNDLMGSRKTCGFPEVQVEQDPAYDPSTVESSLDSLKKRARYQQRVLEHFWRRWRDEYLVNLREHHQNIKSPAEEVASPKVGEVVIVKDTGIVPRGQWKLGVVK